MPIHDMHFPLNGGAYDVHDGRTIISSDAECLADIPQVLTTEAAQAVLDEILDCARQAAEGKLKTLNESNLPDPERNAPPTRLTLPPSDAVTKGQDRWAYIEVMGHGRLAGRVTEVEVAKAGFIRVEVPNEDGTVRFTKDLSPQSIFGISYVEEPIARSLAKQLDARPIYLFQVKELEDELREKMESERERKEQRQVKRDPELAEEGIDDPYDV